MIMAGPITDWRVSSGVPYSRARRRGRADNENNNPDPVAADVLGERGGGGGLQETPQAARVPRLRKGAGSREGRGCIPDSWRAVVILALPEWRTRSCWQAGIYRKQSDRYG